MTNPFFTAFNPKLDTAEKMMGEEWIFKNVKYPAIAIDDFKQSQITAPGGTFAQATTTIHVRKAIFESSGAKRDNVVEARGAQVRIFTISDDGDDSVTLICGPTTAKLPAGT